jgi:energy-coupling factor transporter ATP-binding protein EcfA2
MPKKEAKLPKNKLFYLPNKDKSNHEKWYPKRDLLNIPKPCRVVLVGNPGSGKTNFVKNLILRADPVYQKIYLLHPDEDSKDYDDLGDDIIKLKTIPSLDFCSPDKKNLLIVDDIALTNLSKIDRSKLDRLCGYCSTHRNLSIFLTSQDMFNIIPSVRRNASVFVLYKNCPDLASLSTVASRTGLNSQKLFKIFSKCTSNRDSIMIDLTAESPAKLRINGYDVINSDSEEEEEDSD